MMKKTLLSGGLLLSAIFSQAQQRLALYEEFTGENCPPCATANPGVWTTATAAGNDAKVLLLKYQSPIPSAGPIYNANPIFTDNRIDYYSVSSAPYGGFNGMNFNHPTTNFTQANINAASTGIAAFTVTVSNPNYANGGQTFTATITVTATAAANYANLKLRSALVESLHYATAPGTNGESDFHNVIRQMYDNNGPNPEGQTIDAAWTAGQTRTYTIKGSVPSYAGLNPATPPVNFLAAWVQKDDTKEVLQAGKTGNITLTKPPLDIALTAITGISGIKCQIPTTVTPTITVKNTGTTAINSATVWTNGTSQNVSFTPALAAGASQDKVLNALNITAAGTQNVIDSIGLPNGAANTDLNYYDNVVSGTAYVLNSNAAPLPISYDFEAENNDWVSWPGSGANAFPIVRIKAQTDSDPAFGYGNSAYVGAYLTPYLDQGYSGYLIFPKAALPAGAKAIDFYVAYAMRGTTGDKLELLYTTDCGSNWSSVWSKSNADLASHAPTPNNTYFLPTSDADWKFWSVDITNVPTGANFAFKATSGDGSYIFIDNIKVRTGAATVGIDELIADGSFSIYPNPVVSELNVKIDLKTASTVTYTVFNVLGQQANAPVIKLMNAGTNITTINTSGLAAGMYYLNIATEAGTVQQKFTKQ